MIVALIDNGSLEPAAHRNLRAVADAVAANSGVKVHAVSWKHSDRISADALDGTAAWCLPAFIGAMRALGHQSFLFIPFFLSAQGAVGSALRRDLENLQVAAGTDRFEFGFTEGLAAHGVIPAIVADRIRATKAELKLVCPPVIVVDHGGPSPTSGSLRDTIAAAVRTLLGSEISALTAASMEGEDHPHNLPLLADQLAQPGFNHGDVDVAPLFLSPGRHAGPGGDLAEIATAAEDHVAGTALRCHFTALVGHHPLALEALTRALRHALSPVHAESSP